MRDRQSTPETKSHRSQPTKEREPQGTTAQQEALAAQQDPLAQSISRIGSAPSAKVHASLLSRATSDHPARARQLMLQIQRQYGNQYVQRVVALSQSEEGKTVLTSASFSRLPIQAKLTVSHPNDPYEQEADRVANAVMHQAEPTVERQPIKPEDEEQLQRAVPASNTRQPMNLEDEEQLQRAGSTADAIEVTPETETQINALRGQGQPLPDSVRSFMEPRFGADFSQVRVHTDASAGELAQRIQAQAFTVGQDVVFASGQYAPHSDAGKYLLAHELTHVVQQGYAHIQPKLAISQQSTGKPDTVQRNPLAGMKAAEWLAAAALGYVVTQDAVKSSAGDISWNLDEMSGVLLPGGRTDVEKYKEQNPNLTVSMKELVIAFWKGTESSRKAGIQVGLAFNTDGKGIGNVSARVIDTYDWPMWGATCSVKLMPQTFVSPQGKAVIRVTLTNSWDKTVSSGVHSQIWNLEGDGSFILVRNALGMWVEHSLT